MTDPENPTAPAGAPYTVTPLEDGAVFTIERPAKLNALTKPVLLGLAACIDTLEARHARLLVVTGRGEILDVLRRTLARYQLVMQLVHSGVVRLDGDRACARWQITEFQVLVDGSRRFIAGRYEDDLVRRPGGWQFARRTFTARYVGDPDLTDEVRPDLPARFPLWPADPSEETR